MKTKPSPRVITTNLTLLALALLFGLSLFFAAHFYAIPILTAVGAWAIAHIGLVAASWIAGTVAGASLLAISAELLQPHSVTQFLKGLIGSALNLVTLFAAQKKIQQWLKLGPYQSVAVIPTSLEIKDETTAIRQDLKETKGLVESTNKTLNQLQQGISNLSAHVEQPSSTETRYYFKPPVFTDEDLRRSLDISSSSSSSTQPSTTKDTVITPGAGVGTQGSFSVIPR